ncbi:MAG: hypothetical protein QOG94_3451 [Solirubrobacteraceae bacterium]|jgi:hypothetical protein|nr:hypothetical protein [Solirubrobacteraceae bacterium]
MATIINPKISAQKSSASGNSWEITVEYDATFSAYELNQANFTYRDGFVLMEDDDFFDDQLTGVVGVSVFNPTKSPTHRTMRARIDGETLDTELGQEELFAVVRLRNLDLNFLHQTVASPVMTLSP